MPKTDTGVPVVREVGLASEEAANWRALADASRLASQQPPEDGLSALDVFNGGEDAD